MGYRTQLVVRAVLCFCMVAAVTESASGFSEVQNYFLDSGARALGRGGFAPIDADPEAVSLDDPLSLRIASTAKKVRLDTTYEYQRILRVYGGRWQDSHAYSDALETVAAMPFSLMGDDLKLTAAVGYASNGNDVRAYSKQGGIDLSTDTTLDAVRGALLLSYRDHFMAAMTLDGNDYVSGIQIPFEVRIQPIHELAIGYHQSYFHFKNDIQVTISGKSGLIPFSYNQLRRELYAEVNLLEDNLYLHMGIDPGNLDNLYGEGRIGLPYGFYLAGSVTQQGIDGLRQPFTVSNSPGGYIDVRLNNIQSRVGIGFNINGQWNTEFNYVHSQLDFNGGGIADARAVVDFWPSLIVGNYNYLYSGGVSTDQFQLGGTYEGDRWSFQTGLQYIHLEPSFNLDYWRSVLFGFGRTGAGNVTLTTDSIDMIGLFFGVGYRMGPASFKYALGQFIPFASHENKPETGGGAAPPSGGGKDFFGQIGDKISHHPGGLIQRLQLTVEF